MTQIAELTLAEGTITTIGEKYRVARVLGVGGMGTVYEAENQWTGRRVAIKLLRPELTATPTIVRRFTQEAQAAARIRHDHIVDVLDMGRDAVTGSFFIVQELLEGEDLGSWLRSHRRMTPREAFELLIPVMGALAVAHDEGIVHRDIKPENIFLARSKSAAITPKLIDFGISKLSDADGEVRMTQAGMAIGTPEYMSPEQARGDESIDARTDIWSLGVVLYEIISGSVPYEEKNYNLVVARVLTEPVPPITLRAPELTPSIAAIIDRALQRDRDARYPTIRSMLHDVLACTDLGLDNTGRTASRFGTNLHDAGRETGIPGDRPEAALEPVVTLDDGGPTDRAIPASALRPVRPRAPAFVAAAALMAGVFGSAAMPRSAPPSAHLHHPTLAPPVARAIRLIIASLGPDRPPVLATSSVTARASAVAMASPAPRSTSSARRNVNVALAPSPPSRARSIAFDAGLEHVSASTRDPAEVIPTRAIAPTSVVHRHHIVVE